MNKIKIAVGTTSEYKIGFMKEILDELGISNDVEILSIEAKSKVSEQPLTEKETQTGSINRAIDALTKIPHSDFGLGIEVGYQKDKDGKYEIFCYATIFDAKGVKVSCQSLKLLLPKFHHEKVESGKYLGEYVKEYYQNVTHPVKNYLGKMIDSRKLIIQDAVRQALIRYILKEEF